MEWFIEEPRRGEIALTMITFAITATILWLGRRRKALAVPAALVFFILAAAIIPSAIPARFAAQRNTCINNLRVIQAAKREWARIHHKLAGDIPTEANLCSTNGTMGLVRHPLVCSRGGVYTFGTVAEKPRCSLSHKGHKLD